MSDASTQPEVNTAIPEQNADQNPVSIDAKDMWRSVADQANTLQAALPKKRLAIVGFAPTRDEAPFYDKTWEIWGLNDLHNHIPWGTRWFDIHTVKNIETDMVAGRTTAAVRKVQVDEVAASKMGISGLSTLTIPVYMQEKNEKVPYSVKFPLDEMIAFYEKQGLTGARYLTNSISYMIAFALFEGATVGRQWDEIHIYGVDMAVGDEYIAQRPSCEYWIGIAEGMGVHVFIPEASDLCKTAFLYAYQESQQRAYETKLNKTIQAAQTRMGQLQAQRAEIDRLLHHCEAQIGVTNDFKKVWSNCGTQFKIPVDLSHENK